MKLAVLHTNSELRAFINGKPNVRLGFVPTMGALHEGHLELVRRARRDCELVGVSIFVNPTQFNDPKDLEKYPRNLERDMKLLDSVGADFLFFPEYSQIYSDGYRFKVAEEPFSKTLCGAHRPGHFDGVLTVVMKLLNLVKPTKAYFGEKDYQQLKLITDMVSAFHMGCEIVPCPTVREPDGLAMSSRNTRLTPAHREVAPTLYRVLQTAASDEEARLQLIQNGFRVDYVETVEGRRFGAAFLGDVRLIDNVQV